MPARVWTYQFAIVLEGKLLSHFIDEETEAR